MEEGPRDYMTLDQKCPGLGCWLNGILPRTLSQELGETDLSTAGRCWVRPGWHLSPQCHPPVISTTRANMENRETEPVREAEWLDPSWQVDSGRHL